MLQRVILYKSTKRLSRKQLWSWYIFFYFIMLAVVIWASVYLGVNYDKRRDPNVTIMNDTIIINPPSDGNFSIIIGDRPDQLETLPWIPVHVDDDEVTYDSIYNITGQWNVTMNLTEIDEFVGVTELENNTSTKQSPVITTEDNVASKKNETTIGELADVLLPEGGTRPTTHKEVETLRTTQVPEATEDKEDPVARIADGVIPANQELMEPSKGGNSSTNPSPEVLISSPNLENSILHSSAPEKRISKREDQEERIPQISEIPIMKSSIMTQVPGFNSENFSIFLSSFGEDERDEMVDKTGEFPGINSTEDFIANGIFHYNKSAFRDGKTIKMRERVPEEERESDGISLPVELIRSSEATFHRDKLNSWEVESASQESESRDKITDTIFIESSSLSADYVSFDGSDINERRRIGDGERGEKVENHFDDSESFVSHLMTRDDSRVGLDDSGTLEFEKIKSDVSQETVSHSGGAQVESDMSTESAIITQVSVSSPILMNESNSDSRKNQKIIQLESMINPEFESSSRMTQVDENLTQGYKSSLQMTQSRFYNTPNDSGLIQFDSDLTFDSKLTQKPLTDRPNDSTVNNPRENSPRTPEIFLTTSRNISKFTNPIMSRLISTTSDLGQSDH